MTLRCSDFTSRLMFVGNFYIHIETASDCAARHFFCTLSVFTLMQLCDYAYAWSEVFFFEIVLGIGLGEPLPC